MFTVAINLKDIGQYPNFYEAFKIFYHAIKAEITGGTSWQVLETACWIEYNNTPLFLYDAKDLAYKLGILVDAELQEIPTDQQFVADEFILFWHLAMLEDDTRLIGVLTHLFKKFSLKPGNLESTNEFKKPQ
ncbi:MAG: hypothetical protein WCW78_02125 [Candidatus Paceibacterota bacterium]|jgi:hypothetical protein